MTDLRKEVREMKEEWKTRAEGLEKSMSVQNEKMKEKNEGNRKSNNKQVQRRG